MHETSPRRIQYIIKLNSLDTWLAGRSGYARKYRNKSLQHLRIPLHPSSNFQTIVNLSSLNIKFVSADERLHEDIRSNSGTPLQNPKLPIRLPNTRASFTNRMRGRWRMTPRTGPDVMAKRKSSYKKPSNRTPVIHLFPLFVLR